MYKRKKKLYGGLSKPAIALTKAGVVGGVGASIASGTGTSAGSSAATGIGNFSRSFGAAGSVAGLMFQIKLLKLLKAKSRMRRR